MTLHLGMRILALLAFVAASTTVIVKPELVAGAGASHAPTLNTLVVGRA